MDIQMRLYWEAYSETFTTNDLIRTLHNPLRDYENEFVDGAIVDIGCGQTTFLLDYINTNRKLIGIDNDQYQLDLLKNRLDELRIANSKLGLLNLTLLNDPLPLETYSVVFLANILHFFDLVQCQKIINQLKLNLVSGSFIYVWAHSDKYYRNDLNDPENNEYFKHYFTLADLDSLFIPSGFERLLYSETERLFSKKEMKTQEKWLEKFLDHMEIFDKNERQSIKDEELINNPENDIMCIYKLL
ncbi:class I SAM-dependent methyltransferase [Mucilaginibacter robiniae]|uniref:Class I SAM-dependent methyltransferase n=1 Tax=Mucilaginibacter robiniae TaxID=2728022 RepID=A0A7L5E9W8_9SPHI|nr:class I SAM-dependent methyltransferase [Mucilaginibacter robiniae]QJD97693.1 class I SAM-dependent methyltransferase [Mucilaginibacter robiniae]